VARRTQPSEPAWKRRGVFAKLAADEQSNVIDRAAGKCHLCDRLLELDGSDVAADHFDPKGPITAANIYLAHGRCNSYRQDLDVPTARKLVRFLRFLEDHRDLKLDQVIDEYVAGQKRRSFIANVSPGSVVLQFEEGKSGELPLFEDPTTGWRFFYADVPANYILNDKEAQPRTIKFSQVQRLLKDFTKHPVHEPPACRLVPENGRHQLKMFDGQHKTAAQMALERRSIHLKIYLDPPLNDVRSLVKSVQSTIPKLPLTPGAFTKKMKRVHQEAWEEFLQDEHATISEQEFLTRFGTSAAKSAATRDLIEAHLDEAWHPEEAQQSVLVDYVEPDNPDPRTRYALKQAAFKNKLLKELVWGKPLEEVDPEQFLRSAEGRNVRRLLDILAEVSLVPNWVLPKDKQETTEHSSAARFFQQGSMNGWVDLLKNVIVNIRQGHPIRDHDRPLLPFKVEGSWEDVTERQWKLIKDAVVRIFSHSLWSSSETDVIRAINQNKMSVSAKLLEEKGLTFAYATGHKGR
jgi:hypothetical protein